MSIQKNNLLKFLWHIQKKLVVKRVKFPRNLTNFKFLLKNKFVVIISNLTNPYKKFKKFIKRYKKYNDSQRVSVFQNFDSVYIDKTSREIKVQPTAVSRRKSKFGSRQKQSKVITKKIWKHNVTDIIDQNVPSAKKAGRSMISNKTYFKRI